MELMMTALWLSPNASLLASSWPECGNIGPRPMGAEQNVRRTCPTNEARARRDQPVSIDPREGRTRSREECTGRSTREGIVELSAALEPS